MKSSVALGSTHVGLGELVWRQLSRKASGIRHMMARHRAYAALASLDDRTLEDIGIQRDRIWDVVDEALRHDADKPRAERAGRRSIAA